MKVAFTTAGAGLDAPLEGRFGRAPRFLVYDMEKETFEMIDNREAAASAQGAGVQAAETIARSGARSLVTGHCGPKAFRVLEAAGIKVYRTEAPTIAAALEAFRTGTLAAADSADVSGHWS